jgi:hypothetical protein
MTPQERKSVIEKIENLRNEIGYEMCVIGEDLNDFADDDAERKRLHTLMLAANRQAEGMDKMLSQLAKKLAKKATV